MESIAQKITFLYCTWSVCKNFTLFDFNIMKNLVDLTPFRAPRVYRAERSTCKYCNVEFAKKYGPTPKILPVQEVGKPLSEVNAVRMIDHPFF